MPPKPEIRRLFKQQQSERTKTKRVVHHFAKYDSQGKLSCAVCNATVKTEAVWSVHLTSTGHKENIAKLKAIRDRQTQVKQGRPATEELKRPATDDGETKPEVKRVRFEEESESESESEEEVSDESDAEMEESSSNGLPSDFFDTAPETEEVVEPEPVESSSHSALPAGFFDDAEEDARARKAPRPGAKLEADLEKEYEIFKEAMVEPTIESEKIRDEDEEAFWLDRDEELLRQQVDFDTRVDELKKLRQQRIAPSSRESKKDSGLRVEFDDTEQEIRTGLKKGVRELLKKAPIKNARTVFDDMDEDEDDEDEDEEEWEWRAQQL
ncbi:C2H2-type zinc finger transcription factor [Phycomyces blakesleeanus]